MSDARYEYLAEAKLFVCLACTAAAVEKCPVVNCQKDHRVLVVSMDDHDRYHIEHGARVDPGQQGLFG